MINAYLNQTATFKKKFADVYLEPVSEYHFVVPVRIIYRKSRVTTDVGVDIYSNKVLLIKTLVLQSGFEIDLSWVVEIDGFDWPITAIEEKRHFSTEFYEITLSSKSTALRR